MAHLLSTNFETKYNTVCVLKKLYCRFYYNTVKCLRIVIKTVIYAFSSCCCSIIAGLVSREVFCLTKKMRPLFS